MKRIQRFIVISLESICTFKDRLLPSWWPWATPLLCGCKLALWSSILDDRWQTGEWTHNREDNDDNDKGNPDPTA